MMYDAEPKVRRITDQKSKLSNNPPKKNVTYTKTNKKVSENLDNQRSKKKSSSTHARTKNTVNQNPNSGSSSTNNSETNSSDAKRSSRAGSARSKNVKSAKGSSDNSHTGGINWKICTISH